MPQNLDAGCRVHQSGRQAQPHKPTTLRMDLNGSGSGETGLAMLDWACQMFPLLPPVDDGRGLAIFLGVLGCPGWIAVDWISYSVRTGQ